MRYHLLLFATTVCYAFIGVFVKLIGGGMHPLVIAFFRQIIGVLFLIAAVPFFDRHILSNLRSNPWKLALLGIIAAANFSMYTAAFVYAPITNVILFNSSYAMFAVLFAWLFMREEPTRSEITAIGAGTVGIIILNPLQKASIIGNLLALGCGIMYGMYIAYLRKELKGHGISTALWVLCYSAIFLIWTPFVFGAGEFWANIKWIVLLGILCTGMAQLMLNLGLQNVKTDVASAIIMLGLPISLFFGWVFFGEAFSWRTIFGGAVVIASVVYLEAAGKYGARYNPRLHR